MSGSLPFSMFSAALTAFLMALVLAKKGIPILVEKKIGQQIRNLENEKFLLAELHQQKKNTPTMGGIFIVLATLFSSLLFCSITNPLFLVLAAATVIFASIGAVDDWAKLTKKNSKGISPRSRLLLQTLFALVMTGVLQSGILAIPILYQGAPYSWAEWQHSLFLPFVVGPLFLPGVAGTLFFSSIQWFTIVGAANATNLTDGLDGLASGVSLFVTLFLALYAFFSSSPELAGLRGLCMGASFSEIALYLAAMAGAITGFLWYNAYPAKVFMGDTGSLAIGGTLGTAAVLLRSEWYLALVGLIFVTEALSVIFQVLSFRLFKKRIFRCSPLHHHFEYAGLHEAQVVVRFWIVAAALFVLGMLSL